MPGGVKILTRAAPAGGAHSHIWQGGHSPAPAEHPAAQTGIPAMAKDRQQHDGFSTRYHRLKTEIHRKIVETIDLSKLNRWEPQRVRREVRTLAAQNCASAQELLNEVEREQLIEEVMSEVFGLGPLDV